MIRPILILAIFSLFMSCGEDDNNAEPIPDESATVTINGLVWKAKNASITKFSNGDVIPEAKTIDEWKAAAVNKTPAWCYLDNDPANEPKNGRLYNSYVISDPRGFAPAGWHVPSSSEWDAMILSLGGELNAGHKLKSKTGWKDSGNGTNESGFTGFPSGHRFEDGTFPVDAKGGSGNWLSTFVEAGQARYYIFISFGDNAQGIRFDRGRGAAVRFVKN